MSIVREEIRPPDIEGVELYVLERVGNEMRRPWAFVSLEVDLGAPDMTPKELRELGHWLIKQGKRMGREYKSNGAPKAKATGAPA